MDEVRRAAELMIEDPPVSPTPVGELRRRARRRRGRRIAVATLASVALVGVVGFAVGSRPTKHSADVVVVPTTRVPPTTTPRVTSTTVANPFPNATVVVEAGRFGAHGGWALNGDALYRTDDDGAHWTTITTPDTFDPVARIGALFFLDSQHVWAAVARNGMPLTLYRSTDGGHSWLATVPVTCDLPVNGPSCASPTGMSFVDPLHGWWIGTAPSQKAGVIFSTSDGGRTWTRLASTPFSGPIVFLDRNVALGVSQVGDFDRLGVPHVPGGALYRTTDGGATWTRVQPPAFPGTGSRQTVFDLPSFFGLHAQLGVMGGVVPADAHRHAQLAVWTTADGGASWVAHDAPTPPAADALGRPESQPLLFSAAGASDWTYLVGGSLYVSHDAGKQWTTIAPIPPLGHVYFLQFASPGDGWVISGPALARTRDGGASWSALSP